MCEPLDVRVGEQNLDVFLRTTGKPKPQPLADGAAAAVAADQIGHLGAFAGVQLHHHPAGVGLEVSYTGAEFHPYAEIGEPVA